MHKILILLSYPQNAS